MMIRMEIMGAKEKMIYLRNRKNIPNGSFLHGDIKNTCKFLSPA
jgi:hypothetical protein